MNPKAYGIKKALAAETECNKRWLKWWDTEFIKYKYLAKQAYHRAKNEPSNRGYKQQADKLIAVYEYIRKQHDWHFKHDAGH